MLSSRVLINHVTCGDFRKQQLTISTTTNKQQQQQQHIDIQNSPISDIDSENDTSSETSSQQPLSRSISMLSISSSPSSSDDDMNDEHDDIDDMSASSDSDDDEHDMIEPLHTPQYSVPHTCHQYQTPIATTTTTTNTITKQSKPWSGCQACDHPYLNRNCTQSHLLQLAIDSCLPSTPTSTTTTHTCTSSCTHHVNHIHYTRPSYLARVTLNPAGFIRPAIVETKDDIESTMLGRRRLITKHDETPIMTQRRTSVFTFDRTATATTTTAPHQTPRVPKRASISNIHIPASISTSSSSFIPTLPSIHSSTSSPISSTSELAITVEIPRTPISPMVFPRQQPCVSASPSLMTRTSSTSLARVEEGCATMMVSPLLLSSSRLAPKWMKQQTNKPQQHFVLPPIKQQKFHGVIPSTTTTTHASPPSLPSTWTQPKVMGLYLGYLVLNAAFVMLLHH